MPDMSAVTGPAPIPEEEEEEDDNVEAEGVEDKDIDLVMSQVIWNVILTFHFRSITSHPGQCLKREGSEGPAEQCQRHRQRHHGAHHVDYQRLYKKCAK